MSNGNPLGRGGLVLSGLTRICRCVESLPASRRSPHTVALADGGQNNHSVQRGVPVPPCTQDCCIYWSPRMMTSFPASQRGYCQNVPGSMFVPHVCELMNGLVWKSCEIWKRHDWQGRIPLLQAVWLVQLRVSLICNLPSGFPLGRVLGDWVH